MSDETAAMMEPSVRGLNAIHFLRPFIRRVVVAQALYALGAALCVFLASRESDGITGKLISAQWDPWEKLHDFKADLNSDIYTLRRIVPKDRGKTWGDK